MTTIETSLPIWLLLIGALGSIVFFAILYRSELENQSPRLRWGLVSLRGLLCLLVWTLIAQPKAVTTRKETSPIDVKLGIDVSQSMSLADESGPSTSRWNGSTEAGKLDEAIALTEAARIRINLLSRRPGNSAAEREKHAETTAKLLERARAKTGEFGEESRVSRLLGAPIEKLGDAIDRLQQVDESNPMADLDRSSSLVAQAATGLRRVAAVQEKTRDSDEGEALPRIELVNRWLRESPGIFENLKKEGDLQVATFATGQSLLAEPFDPAKAEFELANTGGDRTHLYENLNRISRKEKTGGQQLTFLITDGVDSTMSPDEFSVDLRNQPLLVLPIGDPDTSPDVRIKSLVNPARVREKDNFLAAVELAGFNSGPETVTVSLIERDETLVSREVKLDGDGTTSLVELEWQARGVGPRNMRVEVSQIEGEDFLVNNLRPVSFTVIKDRYEVLVCDAFPRWETRYLQNLFKRDPSIEMTSIVFEPRHTYPGNEPREPVALPLSLEAWQTFDLVILGDVTPTQLTPDHQKLLVEYVDKGGSLILLAGKKAMPMAFVDTPVEDLLPMIRNQADSVTGSFVISPPENRSISQMVNLGKGNTQAVWRTIFSITPQHTVSGWNRARESARALLVAKDQQSGAILDFFAVQRFGRGRVSFIGAPCLYHLRFRYGDRYHARFWGQVIRGMCVDNFGFEGGLIETRLDRQLWEPGSEVQGRVRLTAEDGGPLVDADFKAAVYVDGEPVAEMSPTADPDRPGDYYIQFPGLPSGKYEIEYRGEEIEMLLESDEAVDPYAPSERCQFEVLAGFLTEEATFALEKPDFWHEINSLPLAATVSPQTLPLMLEALDLKPEITYQTTKRAIWDQWWLLLMLIVISGTEWFLRRIHGLC